MQIKTICSGCGKERKPIIYVRPNGEVIALIEAECPHCKDKTKQGGDRNG